MSTTAIGGGRTVASPTTGAGGSSTTNGAIGTGEGLPPPAGGVSLQGMDIEALMSLLTQIDAQGLDGKSKEIERANADRTKKMQEDFKKLDEQQKAKDSPGFFGAIFKVIKDFASDLVTDPTKLASDLGKNLSDMVNSPNFWSDLKAGLMKVAEVAAVVAATATAVLTCGAGSPVLVGVIIAISALSLAESQFHVAEKLGVDPKIAACISLALSVASIVLSGNVSAVGNAAKMIKEAAFAANVASSVAGVGSGAATAVDAGFQKADMDRRADMKDLQNSMSNLEEWVKELIEQIQDSKDTQQATTDNIQGVAKAQNQPMNILTATRA